MNKYNIFKNIFNNTLNYKDSVLKPRGEVTIYENDKNKDNILFVENNLIVDSFFDIIAGLFLQDSSKQINKLLIGSGGIINNELQTPNVKDTTLYELVFTKHGVENIVVENIVDKYISYSFVIEKDEVNGLNGEAFQVINEIGLASEDGTLFARKTFKEILKTNEKKLFVEWKLYW